MQRYRALREYRDAFPDLVLLRKGDDFPALSAAIEKSIPAAVRAKTRVAPLTRTHPESTWTMAVPGSAYLAYTLAGEPIDLDLSQDNGRYTFTWIDSASGESVATAAAVTGGKILTLTPPTSEPKHPWAAWLTRAP
jgi:hypothetical protein